MLRLDIDGVLVRDKNLLQHVKRNCELYVAKKLPECKSPRHTNSLLYSRYGHTARGLERVFQVDTRDFNSKVYDKPLLNHLAEVLATPQFQKEAEMVHQLSAEGWKLSLFTNSPWVWAYRVALAIGDNVTIKCPGNPADSPLKPEVEAYIFKDGLNIMVDDSLKNLDTARYLANWKTIHFTESPAHGALDTQVTSIAEMCEEIRKCSPQ